MDHTPGQRQWRDLDKYRLFHSGREVPDEAAFQALVRRRIAEQAAFAAITAHGYPEYPREDMASWGCQARPGR